MAALMRPSPSSSASSLVAAATRGTDVDVVMPIKKHNFYPSPKICSSRNLPNHSPFHSLHLPPLIPRLTPSSSSSVFFRGGNGGRRAKPLVEVQNPIIPSPLRRPSFLCCAATSGGGSADSSQEGSTFLLKVAEVLPMAFPLWVTLACFLALARPSAFSWVHSKWQMIGLTITMLGMGMTLTLDDLRGAMLMPKELLSGFVLQYTVMPLSGFLVSKLLNLPSHYAAGLILVSCCPGGTASNIVTYMARGNVALSVLMTTTSTISAVVMTPFLTSALAGQFVAVDRAGLIISTVQVVLAPVLLGALLNKYCNDLVELVSPFMPLIAGVTVALLCGSAVAQNASAILTSGFQVVFAGCLLHASGFFFGYAFSRMLGLDVSSSRTISIEVGMQNSLLGLVLAVQHFGNPLTAVPCAVSSVIHSVYGSVLAGIWRSMKPVTPLKD